MEANRSALETLVQRRTLASTEKVFANTTQNHLQFTQHFEGGAPYKGPTVG